MPFNRSSKPTKTHDYCPSSTATDQAQRQSPLLLRQQRHRSPDHAAQMLEAVNANFEVVPRSTTPSRSPTATPLMNGRNGPIDFRTTTLLLWHNFRRSMQRQTNPVLSEFMQKFTLRPKRKGDQPDVIGCVDHGATFMSLAHRGL